MGLVLQACFVPDTYKCELVVNLHEVLDLVLLQYHKVVQVSARSTGTVLAVHHVRFPAVALAGDEQQVKHLHLCTGARRKRNRRAGKTRRIMTSFHTRTWVWFSTCVLTSQMLQ